MRKCQPRPTLASSYSVTLPWREAQPGGSRHTSSLFDHPSSRHESTSLPPWHFLHCSHLSVFSCSSSGGSGCHSVSCCCSSGCFLSCQLKLPVIQPSETRRLTSWCLLCREFPLELELMALVRQSAWDQSFYLSHDHTSIQCINQSIRDSWQKSARFSFLGVERKYCIKARETQRTQG